MTFFQIVVLAALVALAFACGGYWLRLDRRSRSTYPFVNPSKAIDFGPPRPLNDGRRRASASELALWRALPPHHAFAAWNQAGQPKISEGLKRRLLAGVVRQAVRS